MLGGNNNREVFAPYFLSVTSLALVYALISGLSFYLGYALRFDFEIPTNYYRQFVLFLFLVVPLKLLLLMVFGQFRQILSYFSIPDLTRIFYALCSTSLLLLLSWLVVDNHNHRIPRGVILADLLFSLVFLVGLRTAIRLWHEKYAGTGGESPFRPVKRERIGIFGAGSAGAALAAELLSKPHLGLKPLVFLDDDPAKFGKNLHGIPVVDASLSLAQVASRFDLSRFVIAMPSIRASRIRDFIKEAAEAKIDTRIVPSLHELSTGRVQIDEIRQVRVEDVLGREPVDLNTEDIKRLVVDKVVWITGAGGSIGSEIARQIISLEPRKLILQDLSEAALFQMQYDLLEQHPNAPIEALVASVGEEDWMRQLIVKRQPDIIFHAAAYKHVYLMEVQPSQAFRNNAVFSHRFAEIAARAGVPRMVLISTDKAVHPNSVMGASKRLAECSLIYLQKQYPDTKMMSVRFGNVLESSGSVIPIFKRQIANGGPVTVTHPEATRYFMTIPEAVGLVLQAASMGQGGEIFVLDMGEPVRILDLARQMIQLSGFVPDKEIFIEFTGLRQGEKLHEELDSSGESVSLTSHPRILQYRADSSESTIRFEDWITDLNQKLYSYSNNELKEILHTYLPDYTPSYTEKQVPHQWRT